MLPGNYLAFVDKEKPYKHFMRSLSVSCNNINVGMVIFALNI